MSERLPYRYLLLVLLFSVRSALPLQAQQPRVEASLDSNSVWVGGNRTIHLSVNYAPGVRLHDPGTSVVDTAQAIELLREGGWDTLQQGTQAIILGKDLLITAWDSGFFEIPAIPFPYEVMGQIDTTYTNPLRLRANLAPVDTIALQPLKPIIEEPVGLEDFLPYLLGLFATVALAALAWWYWKRRNQRPKPVPETAPEKPVHEKALEQLEALAKEQLWQQGLIKEYHTRLTHILREYLENRFQILALESTTREIASQLKHKVEENLRQNIIQLLNTSDMVKFAKAQPPESVHDQLLERAREFVHRTKEVKSDPDSYRE